MSAGVQYVIILLLDKPFYYAGAYLTEPMSRLVSENDRSKTQTSEYRAYSLLFLIMLVCAELFFSPQPVLGESYSISPENDERPVWVFFADKGISSENDMDTARVQTPLKARIRRHRKEKFALVLL